MPRSIAAWSPGTVMSRGPFGVPAVALLLLLGSACSDVSKALPQHKDEQFELKQDKRGRIIRLNKATGEVAVVDGTQLVPIRPPDTSAKRVTAQRIPTHAPASAVTPKPAASTPLQPTPADGAVGNVPASEQSPAQTATIAGARAVTSIPTGSISGGVLDEISLYGSAPPPRAAPVVIRPFSATDTDLGTGATGGKAIRQSEARLIQKQGPKLLADRFASKLKELGPYTDVSVLEPGADVPPDAIVVDGRFTAIDPGSRAKRYWVGFGVGKSMVAVSGSVKNADGRLLATFAQKRLGVIDGDSVVTLSSDSRAIGGDIAQFVSVWASGKKLK
jgi:hypothetical protein